jgi:diacylglycerol kinase
MENSTVQSFASLNLLHMTRFIRQVQFAWKGIISLIRTERHFRYHLVATIIVTSAGLMLALTAEEWLFIASAIFSVLVAEGFNTSIERLCDLISMEKMPAIKFIKDVSAGAVLMASIYSFIVGTLIFLPKLAILFNP